MEHCSPQHQEQEIMFGYAINSQLPDILELWKNIGVYNEDEDQISILEKVISYDQRAIITLSNKDQIIGSCMIVYHPFQTFVYRFGIHSNFHGQGYGSQLAQYVDVELVSRGMLHPTLFVEGDNEIGKQFRSSQGRKNLYSVDCFVKNLETSI